MTQNKIADDLREKIIRNPSVVLDDNDVMRALVGAHADANTGNVVDLRGVAMARLEARFDRLEDTHRTVIAAAYDNVAGTNQVHRAVLRMLEAETLDDFISIMTGDVADILRVDVLRLFMESHDAAPDHVSDDSLALVPENFVDGYVTLGRNMPARIVTLRPYQKAGAAIYGERAQYMKSEACLKLDLGAGQMPAMLLMASEDPQMFTPQQATDLMGFVASVAARMLRRWLAA